MSTSCGILEMTNIDKYTVLHIFWLVGRGVPSNLKHVTWRTVSVQENRFPTPDESVEIYQPTYHGNITEPSAYGTDLLEDDKELQQIRYNDFIEYHNIKLIFADIVNGKTDAFRSALLLHSIESTRLFTISSKKYGNKLKTIKRNLKTKFFAVFDYESNFEKHCSY